MTDPSHLPSEESSHKPVKRQRPSQNSWALPASIVFASLVFMGTSLYISRLKAATQASALNAVALPQQTKENDITIDPESVLPSKGVELPIVWGDIGKRLIDSGVINNQKFESLYAQRGGLSAEMKTLLTASDNGKIRMTLENAGVLLNIAWALGLGDKNPVLEQGPMNDKQYGGAGNFASTGGWSLSTGDTMSHYSKHPFIVLTPDQQSLLEKVAKGIYRPCCGNSVYFPDCNHGMAMLGLLELMASQNVSEDDMFHAALAVNSYWFPDTYVTITKFFAKQGVAWDKVSPREVLGANYSSSSGYRQILQQVKPVQAGSGGGCSV
ncbi:hypothetical protein HZA43_03820 [Candidatus Peregrinibacteria bacterium]|nr:hypothetical protein [Candidatus Peregrinibacteria bacterium]